MVVSGTWIASWGTDDALYARNLGTMATESSWLTQPLTVAACGSVEIGWSGMTSMGPIPKDKNAGS